MANTPKHKMEVRARMLYATELMRLGYSDTVIKDMIREKYGVSPTTTSRDVKLAYNWLKDNDSSGYINEIRAKQVERSEYILQKAIQDKNWKSANSILDNLNKLLGLYENKQKVEIVADEIRFKFGAESMKDVVIEHNDREEEE